MRKLVLGMVLACLMVNSVQAGLQDALTNALVGLRVTPLVISGVLNPTLPLPLPPIPKGALFIDPILSTRGEGVFREGPDFHYDATTGGVTVFAPPMLGPADEFGVRREYSPGSIQFVAEEFLADAPSIPQLTRYVRGEPDFAQYGYYPLPLEDDDPSFVIDDYEDFNLYLSAEDIRVSVGAFRGWAGAEVEFVSLLKPGLEADVFAAAEGEVLPNGIWPYLPSFESALPAVHFVVQYHRINTGLIRLGDSGRFSLLAVPQTDLFLGGEGSVPEPSSILLATFSLIVLLTSRRVPAGK